VEYYRALACASRCREMSRSWRPILIRPGMSTQHRDNNSSLQQRHCTKKISKCQCVSHERLWVVWDPTSLAPALRSKCIKNRPADAAAAAITTTTTITTRRGHSIECKLTPATRSPSTVQLKYVFALCDPMTLTSDLLN